VTVAAVRQFVWQSSSDRSLLVLASESFTSPSQLGQARVIRQHLARHPVDLGAGWAARDWELTAAGPMELGAKPGNLHASSGHHFRSRSG
jgi:hypothetical protein